MLGPKPSGSHSATWIECMAKHVYRYDHPIVDKWLRGTTCHQYWIGRGVLFENADYIVLKHNSHIIYRGRFNPPGTCRAYAKLYRKADLCVEGKGCNNCLDLGAGEIVKWEGRIAKSRVLEDCKAMGIIFVTENEESTHA